MIAGALEIQLLANVARLAKDMQDAKGAVTSAMGSIEKTVGVARTAGVEVSVSVDQRCERLRDGRGLTALA